MTKTSTLFMGGFRKSIGDGVNEIMARTLERIAEIIARKSRDDTETKLREIEVLRQAAKIIRKHRHLQSRVTV